MRKTRVTLEIVFCLLLIALNVKAEKYISDYLYINDVEYGSCNNRNGASFKNGTAVVEHGNIPENNDGSYFFINDKGERLHSKAYYRSAYNYTEGLAAVISKYSYGSYWQYIDIDGNVIIDKHPNGNKISEARPFYNGRAMVEYSGLKGVFLINKQGEIIKYLGEYQLHNKFSGVFFDGITCVQDYYKSNNYTYFDINGNKIWRGYNVIYGYNFQNGLAFIKRPSSGKFNYADNDIYINTKGEEFYASDALKNKYNYVEDVKEDIKAVETRNGYRYMYNNLSAFVNNNTYKEIKAWATKGEFENTEMYNKRVNDAKITELTTQLNAYFKNMYLTYLNTVALKKINIRNVNLGAYNADSETFSVEIPGFNVGDINLNVDIEVAQAFKANWEQIKYTLKLNHQACDKTEYLLSYYFTFNNKEWHAYVGGCGG